MTDIKRQFIRFSRLEVASGGPDSQIQILAALCKDCDRRSQLMLAGMYGIIYDVTSAEYFWNLLPKKSASENPKKSIERFVNENWNAIVIRTERRCVRTRSHFLECLKGYVDWVDSFREPKLSGRKLYDYMWNSVTAIPYIGRYAAIKLLRSIKECAGIPVTDYDIRPDGGWSPRYALGLLYPEYADILNSNTSDFKGINSVADIALRLLNKNRIVVGHYELQTLLCNFRETLKGNRFYPGRSHDEVLENWHRKKLLRVGFRTKVFDVRKKIFPNEHLGELQGWEGIRKELQATLKKHGYVWSDLKYDYHKTFDLAEPVLR